VILAIGVDQDPSDYESFVRTLTSSFFVARDKDRRLVSEERVPTMPTSYLMDRAGTVKFIHPGFRGAATEQALHSEIAALVSEKAP
jgi:hypothetical protein